MDALTVVQLPDVAVLQQVPVLAPMPAIGVESLARAAREQRCAVGDVVVRHGELGELFYAVAEGTLRVWPHAVIVHGPPTPSG